MKHYCIEQAQQFWQVLRLFQSRRSSMEPSPGVAWCRNNKAREISGREGFKYNISSIHDFRIFRIVKKNSTCKFVYPSSSSCFKSSAVVFFSVWLSFMSLVHSEAVEEDLDNVDCVSEDGPEILIIFTGIVFDNCCNCLAGQVTPRHSHHFLVYSWVVWLRPAAPPCL